MNDDANEPALFDEAESATARHSSRPGKLTREQKIYVVRRLSPPMTGRRKSRAT